MEGPERWEPGEDGQDLLHHARRRVSLLYGTKEGGKEETKEQEGKRKKKDEIKKTAEYSSASDNAPRRVWTDMPLIDLL